MFNPHAKHRQEKFVKFFTILAALMNRISCRVESSAVLAALHVWWVARPPRAHPVGALADWPWMLDVGCWMLDVGCWMLDVGCWMLDVGRWTLDVGRWTLDVGRWTLDVGCWFPCSLHPRIGTRVIAQQIIQFLPGLHLVEPGPLCAAPLQITQATFSSLHRDTERGQGKNHYAVAH